ncbi:short-chain dehydrogenase/reductase-like protein SDR [Apodospora peruviana]|uniref:Short-chain dehydrogenase/reductase-like protein SDR n=1 Tax=Apodospora peruviana TaxID=516989 RepID=A0AAE0I5U3_9PEZI|nr:short-chain dehydrogenase/reductase-like protein SDR [Apodospora peruviana]
MDVPKQQIYQLPSDAVWFITGCSSGIGKALAQLIASKATQNLVATARDPSTLSYLPDSSPRILKLSLDVTSPESISSALSSTLSRFGHLDVVINNAGYSLSGDAETTPSGLARQIIDTNFWGVVEVTKRALPIMRDINPNPNPDTISSFGHHQQQKGGGVILNVTSMGGRIAYPGSAFYHASKFAVEGYTEAVSKELHPSWNIHLSLIEPGGVQTNYATSSMRHTAEKHAAYQGDDMSSRIIEKYIADPKNRESWADANKIAEAVWEVVALRVRERGIPLRVPLGPDAWGALKMDHERNGKLLDEARELALSVGKEGQFDAIRFLV